MNIHNIPVESINRICASQTIQGLGCCVRELVENSLDSQATSVSVRIRNRGDEIEVADNGTGIGESDWRTVCVPHATSKITDFEDVLSASLQSHGFRGEALSSLCALARSVRIVTRTGSMDSGRVLLFGKDGSLLDSSECVSKAIGTTVTVYGLFQESLPVRHREMIETHKHDVKTVQRYMTEWAIIHWSKSFELLVDGKCSVNSQGGADGYQVYQRVVNGDNLVPFECHDDTIGLFVSGWVTPTVPTPLSIGLPVVSRSVVHQFLFINGKPITASKRLVKPLSSVYASFSVSRVSFILLLSLKNERLFDINVAVDKRTIVFAADVEEQLLASVSARVKQMFAEGKENKKPLEKVEMRSTNLVQLTLSEPVRKKRALETVDSPDLSWTPPESRLVKRILVESPPREKAVVKPLSVINYKPLSEIISAPPTLSAVGANELEDTSRVEEVEVSSLALVEEFHDIPPQLPVAFGKHLFLDMEIIGQFNRGFILAKLSDGDKDLFLIDQHAANEKFLFEQYYRNIKVIFQMLISPIQLKLSPMLESVAIEHAERLSSNGFKVAINETMPPGNRVKLLSLPTLSGVGFNRSASLTVADLMEILEKLEDDASSAGNGSCELLKLLGSVRAMLASKACRTAVMVGDSLNSSRMTEIVQSLATLDQPWNCPHGRPTLKHLLSLDDLRNLD